MGSSGPVPTQCHPASAASDPPCLIACRHAPFPPPAHSSEELSELAARKEWPHTAPATLELTPGTLFSVTWCWDFRQAHLASGLAHFPLYPSPLWRASSFPAAGSCPSSSTLGLMASACPSHHTLVCRILGQPAGAPGYLFLPPTGSSMGHSPSLSVRTLPQVAQSGPCF